MANSSDDKIQNKVEIRLEFTPNPTTLKFVVNQTLLPTGSANFTDPNKTADAPLAEALMKVSGVTAVLIGTNFVTVTKGPTGEWDVVAEEIPKTIESFLTSGKTPFSPNWKPADTSNEKDTELEKKIREVLDAEIRPAVAMDGGDILFDRFEDGVVYLHLQGACSSCPSSTATLRMGVEVRLKELIPEIREVVQT